MSPDVVVSGAGVGGLACATALGALGLSVLVLERRQTPLDVAKGEVLQPEAVRLLDRWGALVELRAAGAMAVSRLAIRDGEGQPQLTLDYDTLAGDYRQILCTGYQTVLNALGATLGPTVDVRRGVLVEGAQRDSCGRVIGVRISEGDRRHDVAARLVIAADGLSSRLRAEARIPIRRHSYDHQLLALELAGASMPDEVTAYTTDRGLRLMYPLPGNRCRLYVQVGAEESQPASLADPTAWCDRLLREVPALAPWAGAVHDGLPTRQRLAVSRLRSPQLSTPGLALVGESAHAVHPMAAQGVNTSLADAQALADHLARAGDLGDNAVDEALQGYDRSRLGRLDHIATVSHNAARMLTTTGGFGRLLGRRVMRHTAANPRLVRLTTGNMAGIDLRPLTRVDRLYQLGLLNERSSAPAYAADRGTARR